MQKSSRDAFGFEELAAIYRVEGSSPSLSAVRKDLYPSIAKLMKSLNAEYSKQLSIDPDSLICEGINQRRGNVRKMFRVIIENRIRKICSLALIGAMGANNVIDHLTPEEKEYYNDVLSSSKRLASVLTHLTGEKKYETVQIDEVHEPRKNVKTAEPEPFAALPEHDVMVETEHGAEFDSEPPADLAFDDMADLDFADDGALAEEDEIFKSVPKPAKVPAEAKIDETKTMIRILEDLPEFSGPDRDYRLFKEDVVMMPKVMADALISRGKAMSLHPTA